MSSFSVEIKNKKIQSFDDNCDDKRKKILKAHSMLKSRNKSNSKGKKELKNVSVLSKTSTIEYNSAVIKNQRSSNVCKKSNSSSSYNNVKESKINFSDSSTLDQSLTQGYSFEPSKSSSFTSSEFFSKVANVNIYNFRKDLSETCIPSAGVKKYKHHFPKQVGQKQKNKLVKKGLDKKKKSKKKKCCQCPIPVANNKKCGFFSKCCYKGCRNIHQPLPSSSQNSFECYCFNNNTNPFHPSLRNKACCCPELPASDCSLSMMSDCSGKCRHDSDSCSDESIDKSRPKRYLSFDPWKGSSRKHTKLEKALKDKCNTQGIESCQRNAQLQEIIKRKQAKAAEPKPIRETSFYCLW